MAGPTLRDRLVVPISFWERFRSADPGLMAAAVAYNAFFALVPSAFAFVAAASFIGQSEAALARTDQALRAVLPEQLASALVGVVRDVADLVEDQQGWIIALSLLIAVWSGSRGIFALQKALARIERLTEHRPPLRVWLIGILLTLGAGLTVGLVLLLVVAGEEVVRFLEAVTTWTFIGEVRVLVGVPAAAIGGYLALYAVFRWGPPQPIAGTWLAALVGAAATAITTLAFGLYLNEFAFSSLFAVLGTFAGALLWLYFTSYVLLFVAAAVGYGIRRRAQPDPADATS